VVFRSDEGLSKQHFGRLVSNLPCCCGGGRNQLSCEFQKLIVYVVLTTAAESRGARRQAGAQLG
jgi:ABC-type sulfate transport system substrate-binding protein